MVMRIIAEMMMRMAETESILKAVLMLLRMRVMILMMVIISSPRVQV